MASRSLRSHAPENAEVGRLATQVFDALAVKDGDDTLSPEDLKKCSAILAQLSEGSPQEVANCVERLISLLMDPDVDSAMFVEEATRAAEIAGSERVAAALGQVASVAADASARARADELAEKLGHRGGGYVSNLAPGRHPSSRPASGRPPSSRPVSGRLTTPARGAVKPVFGGYPAAADMGLSLDIRQKPLHQRGQRGRKASLKAREKVIENMLEYFKSLREEYERKLSTVQDQRKDLEGKEEVGFRFTPREPHGLLVGRTSGACADGDVEGAVGREVAVRGSDSSFGIFRVDGLEPEGQAERLGVESEWLIDKIEGEDFTLELLAAAQAGTEDYTVAFLRSTAGGTNSLFEDEPPPKRVFSDVKDRQKLPTPRVEDEEEEDDEEGGEEAQDGNGAATDGEDEGGEDGGEEDGEEAEEEAEAEAEEEAEDEGDEDGEEDEEEEGEDEDVDDEDADEGEVDACDLSVSQVALADGPEDGDKDEGAPPSPMAATTDAVDSAGDGAAADAPEECVADSKLDATKKKKKAKKKSNKVQPKEPKVQAKSEVKGVHESEATMTKEEVTRTPSPEPGEKSATKGKGKPGKLEEEGISCVKTMDMGLAIRSAICLGKEVWCADWKGAVTIRDRDDASCVKAEIPTNRYIWCMGHQEPGLLWMGQESQGISLFDSRKKIFKCPLTGGHTGGIYCLALDEALGDEEGGAFPSRRGYSGSNDFTIRQWWVETWKGKDAMPSKVRANLGKYTVVDLSSNYYVGIAPGLHMHGHTNGVRALLRIGPSLFSGSDDGSIRIWSCAEGDCTEIIEEAHKGSVLKLVVVRSYLWSAGSDGLIKEWLFGNIKTTCVRQLAPPGFEKSVYAIVPSGHDVWSCGHHPNIRMISQAGMNIHEEYEAHTPYVSNLLAVDRVETRILWSTSIGDKKLKVWRHTIRGNVPSFDEIKAANSLYEREAQSGAEKMEKLLDSIAQLETMLDVAGHEYQNQLDDLARRLAEEQAARDDLDERRKFLEAELDGLRKLFEEAGLAHLLEDPEALRSFLDIKRLFDEAGLGNLLTDPEALNKFLSLGQILKDLGLERFLDDPQAMREFLRKAIEIQDILKKLGLQELWANPAKLEALLQSHIQLKKILEDHGLGDALKDPSKLAEILSRYAALKGAFGSNGCMEMFEDPTYTLNGFLKNHNRIRQEFANVKLEYLMDSPPAMREFLAANAAHAEQLKELQQLRDKVALLEKMLDKAQNELAAARVQLAEFAKWKDICPSLEDLQKMKEEAGQCRTLKKLRKQHEKEIDELRALLEQKERERAEALERERMMALKYKELDIFKLDVIARELKAIDNEFNLVGKTSKALLLDAGNLKNMDEREQISPHGHHILDQCKDLRAHIRDVIAKCLSETQKFHIGVALEDHTAAGELKDGGVMAGYVVEEIDRPDYGSSKAARLRQDDELRREMHSRDSPDLRRHQLPRIGSAGRRSPAGHH